MAGTSLLALIDDIASILDDISLMSKVAAKQTAGVLGDDLALNAQQVAGVNADRELPVVWAVAKGSLKNKVILLPAALAISAFIPWAVMPLLMVGGAYLCYEGFEKLAHKLLHTRDSDDDHLARHTEVLADPAVDMVALEKAKIKGAIRTDFILSAEIIVIALGTVAKAPFGEQVVVMILVAFVMTAGVYGIVAGIVKLDDGGLYLSRQLGNNLFSIMQRGIGGMVLKAAPYLMKAISILGTVAMFVVGGGILNHGIPGAHGLIHRLAHGEGTVPGFGTIFHGFTTIGMNALTGIVVGAVTLVLVSVVVYTLQEVKRKKGRQ
jgi:predicted DNA repair protein MutK